MKIMIVASHSFPIPYKNLHTGDLVILELAKELSKKHAVTMCAPKGTDFPNLIEMPCSYGKYPPSSQECELNAGINNQEKIEEQDIIHDFSNTKEIAFIQSRFGYKTISTLMGGANKTKVPNLCTWSQSHQERVTRGATDYENTPTPLLAGDPGFPSNSHVVHGGINTNFYSPGHCKENYYLWLGRWHDVRGYKLAIDIAKQTGINLIVAGEHPDNELFQSQKDSYYDAVNYANGINNITFISLLEDPAHHEHKRILMRNAKAFLYTVQFHEPFGLSQVESLACGTPVIGTNYGSIPEIIKHGVTGYVCENSVDSFANAIKNINNINPQDCRDDAVNRFDISVMAGNYLKQYKKVIKGETW